MTTTTTKPQMPRLFLNYSQIQRIERTLGYLTVLATEAAVLREHRAAAALSARALELDIALIRALGGGFAPDAIAAAR